MSSRRGQSWARAALASCAALALLGGAPRAEAQTVRQAVSSMGPCQSHLVKGLSDQVLRTHLCSFPETLVSFSHRNISMNSGVDAYGTPEMVAALYRAADGGPLHVNSAFRTLVVQYAYFETDLPGTSDGCWGPARPGESRHEWGNAVDLANPRSVAPRMRAAGFTWWGPDGIGPEWDEPHFTAGPERRGHGVRAFQRLWNINNPGDRIEEDGAYGPITASKLEASPAAGFPMDGCGPVCTGRGDDEECGVRLLHDQVTAYASPRSTDVNGDGRADLCARGSAGVRCWIASPSGWTEEWPAIPWSDTAGWDDVTNYATLRMGDVNGDGRADVCARSNTNVICALSNGAGFDAASTWAAGLSDASGWNAPQHYTTLRLADVNGDGMDDLCARDGMGFGCWLSTGAAFETRVEGPRWSNDAGFTRAKYYGTLRMGDLDGDRRADVCIRAAAGMRCALSDGAGFSDAIAGPAWSDDAGFDQMEYWSTIRLADVNGDGQADLCVRTPDDLRCVLSTGTGFGETVIVGPLSDENGWADITNYATLRVGDIDGDGADDLCLRGDSRVGCWAWDGAGFVQRGGPEWADTAGWNGDPGFYQTMRVADFDGDGLEDVCARASGGWRCHPSRGDSFGDAVGLDELTNAGGWDAHPYWSTIMSAGHACRPELEVCNGEDDDCDGWVDEELSCGLVESDAAPPGVDGGMEGELPGLDTSCACRAGAPRGGSPFGAGALLVLGALLWRSRRR